MHYLKLVRYYATYAVLLIVVVAGSVYQANHGCTPHTGSNPGFQDVGPHDRVIYRYRDTTPEAYDYGDFVVYLPRVRRAEEARDQITVGRVAGKPGDVLAIRNGQLIRNGSPATDVMPDELDEAFPDMPPLTVPRDTLWLLGGNADAEDSRTFGPVAVTAVHGKAVYVRR